MSLTMRSVLLIAGLVASFVAVHAEKGRPTAKVVSIQKHAQGRVAYWEGRVPIFDGNPVYDITLRWNNKMYLVRYESLTGYYPRAWDVGREISVKHERGQFFLYRGEEAVPAREISSSDCVLANHPASALVTPQVPCD
jgi:hypothetical protein